MKKLFCILLALMITFCICGCASNIDETPSHLKALYDIEGSTAMNISFKSNTYAGIYVGQAANGTPSGTGEFTGYLAKDDDVTEDKLLYSGGWKDGKFHGEGSLTLPDGDVYSGSFNEGRLDGNFNIIHSDGSYTTACYENDKRFGGSFTYSASGEFIRHDKYYADVELSSLLDTAVSMTYPQIYNIDKKSSGALIKLDCTAVSTEFADNCRYIHAEDNDGNEYIFYYSLESKAYTPFAPSLREGDSFTAYGYTMGAIPYPMIKDDNDSSENMLPQGIELPLIKLVYAEEEGLAPFDATAKADYQTLLNYCHDLHGIELELTGKVKGYYSSEETSELLIYISSDDFSETEEIYCCIYALPEEAEDDQADEEVPSDEEDDSLDLSALGIHIPSPGSPITVTGTVDCCYTYLADDGNLYRVPTLSIKSL